MENVNNASTATATVADDRIKKEVTTSNVSATKVYKSEWQKEGTETAELRQIVKTISLYPTKSVSNDLKDNIFDTKAFGFEEKPYENIETRVGWMDVPVGTTPEKVNELLTKFPGACLYKMLSNKPILTSDQKYAIDNNITTPEIIAARQAVRYSETHDVVAQRGQLIPDVNGKVQYRAIFFSKTARADVDSRTQDPADFFASVELQTEIDALGQTVL